VHGQPARGGEDTHSFASALKHVLRQDPDIILVGEMRDLETISVALTAAETGTWSSPPCTPRTPPRPSTG
jgi:Tfp pilus assembly pilus retraction ATPase PilT